MASSEATQGQTPDQYGQLHPIETPELLARKSTEFEQELSKLSDQDWPGLKQAQEKCPELLTDAFKLMFLRCEVFNADLAAKRYAVYWEKRIEIFGPERAYLPLTLDGALKDDWTALTTNFIQIIPGVRDAMGRSIIYVDSSKQDKTKYEKYSMVRTFWYMLHAAVESEEAQQHGVVVMLFPHNAKISQFDRELLKINIVSLQGVIPIRASAIHLCRPPSFFKLVLVFVRLMTSKRTQKRMLVHFGDEKTVLEKIANYGLDKDMVPTDLGGNVKLDVVSWLEQRKSEGK
mmetsp:Transcript_14728/g.30362  ORF Transcript_14728/g.30362 Transcript_14728/m.30362 type:complete len:289 (-) Transcript_14728:355-1221(-)